MLGCENTAKICRPSAVEYLLGADNGAAMIRDYHSAASRYRPTPVRVLFIAESPPAFGSESERAYFFFEENRGGDLLFATIVEAVLGIKYRKRVHAKDHVLRCFQKKGVLAHGCSRVSNQQN